MPNFPVENTAITVRDGAAVAYQTIEGFELGDLSQYCDPPASGSSDVRTSVARSGDFGLYQQGFDFVGTVEGENGHPGPFQSPGDSWEFYAYFPTTDDATSGMNFHAFALGTTGACDTTDAMGHRFEIQHQRGGPTIQIRDTVAGATQHVDLSGSYPAGEWIRTEVEWDDSTAPITIRAEPFDADDKSLTGGTAVTMASDNMTGHRGFGYRNSSSVDVYWDDTRLLP